ncbi:MAG: hypothetical protein MUC34_09410 [Anaerolineae bacterium]|nr:hypothetical protein [Anaerolineae bacterium]
MMRFGADAADAVRNHRHLFDRPADGELLEAAQLGNLEVGVGNVPFVVQEDGDFAVALEARDWIDGDALHNSPTLSRAAGATTAD